MAIGRKADELTQYLLKAAKIGISRGERVLFKDVSLCVHSQEILLLRGNNGAGKTTLLRILAGLTQAETGTISRPAAHHWVGHKNGMKPHETPETHLRHWAKTWGSNTNISTELKNAGLWEVKAVPAKHLSAGQCRRVALTRLTLAHRPLWLLDEPFAALDVESQKYVTRMAEAHQKRGGTIIAAIHGKTNLQPTQEMTL